MVTYKTTILAVRISKNTVPWMAFVAVSVLKSSSLEAIVQQELFDNLLRLVPLNS